MGRHDLLKEFSRKATLAYARARQPRAYVGPTLFPVNTVNELTFQYWKGQNLLPVMATLQAYGAEASIASRDGAEKVFGEIPPIKRKINLDERMLIALKREGAGDVEMVRNQLYNDLDNMIDAVQARIEKMRMDAIAYGQLTLAENGVIMNVDYGVPAALKEVLAGTALWSDHANSKPIDNIQAWTAAAVDSKGIRPTRALTSNTAVSHLIQNAQVRTMIYGDQGAGRAVSLPQVNELLRSLDLPIIAVNDMQARVQAEDGTISTVRFFPSTRFVLLPPQPLGETLMGPTAEALLDPEVEAREAAGIYAIVTQETEPPGVWTKAAATAIPTFPMADSVFIAVVLAEE
ncbi:MAG: major capsid protein [Bacteroidota bacterium]